MRPRWGWVRRNRSSLIVASDLCRPHAAHIPPTSRSRAVRAPLASPLPICPCSNSSHMWSTRAQSFGQSHPIFCHVEQTLAEQSSNLVASSPSFAISSYIWSIRPNFGRASSTVVGLVSIRVGPVWANRLRPTLGCCRPHGRWFGQVRVDFDHTCAEGDKLSKLALGRNLEGRECHASRPKHMQPLVRQRVLVQALCAPGGKVAKSHCGYSAQCCASVIRSEFGRTPSRVGRPRRRQKTKQLLEELLSAASASRQMPRTHSKLMRKVHFGAFLFVSVARRPPTSANSWPSRSNSVSI